MIFNHFRKIKLVIILLILVFSGLYVYLVNTSVFAVAGRRDNEERISQLEASVSNLEADYMTRANEITLELAKELGFIDATGKIGFALKDRPVGMARN